MTAVATIPLNKTRFNNFTIKGMNIHKHKPVDTFPRIPTINVILLHEWEAFGTRAHHDLPVPSLSLPLARSLSMSKSLMLSSVGDDDCLCHDNELGGPL